jgi:hypothetical protein
MKTLVTLTAALLIASPAAAKDVVHSFESAVARGQVQRVLIDLTTGTFRIRNGEASRLALTGVASRDYDSQRERLWAQKVVDDTSVVFEINGADAIVKRKLGRNAQSWRARRFTGIDLRLDLPPGVDVKFRTTAGEIDMAGDFGDIDIDLRAGEVRLRVPRARVRELKASCRVGEVRTNLGTEVVTREGILPGRTEFFNPQGRTRVSVHVTAGEVNVTLTD